LSLHTIYEAEILFFFFCVRVLVGTGRACFESLRPLAYSLLAEIVHHVRGDLSLSQVIIDEELLIVFNVDLDILWIHHKRNTPLQYAVIALCIWKILGM